MLAVALSLHMGGLRASLRAEYGMRVDDLRSLPVVEAADLVWWIPAGSAFWKSMGGPASLSDEARELRDVKFLLRIVEYRLRNSKGTPPKPDPAPAWAHEKQAREQQIQRKAEAYLKRQRG